MAYKSIKLTETTYEEVCKIAERNSLKILDCIAYLVKAYYESEKKDKKEVAAQTDRIISILRNFEKEYFVTGRRVSLEALEAIRYISENIEPVSTDSEEKQPVVVAQEKVSIPTVDKDLQIKYERSNVLTKQALELLEDLINPDLLLMSGSGDNAIYTRKIKASELKTIKSFIERCTQQ